MRTNCANSRSQMPASPFCRQRGKLTREFHRLFSGTISEQNSNVINFLRYLSAAWSEKRPVRQYLTRFNGKGQLSSRQVYSMRPVEFGETLIAKVRPECNTTIRILCQIPLLRVRSPPRVLARASNQLSSIVSLVCCCRSLTLDL
jgi:hypothetical protein